MRTLPCNCVLDINTSLSLHDEIILLKVKKNITRLDKSLREKHHFDNIFQLYIYIFYCIYLAFD